jgi:uncharacterized phage protein (TIGR02218 family)
MREVSAALEAHLTQPLTTLATCVKIARKDGHILAFTDCDVNLTIAGVTYRASEALSPTRVNSAVNLAVDHLEMDGALSDDAITEGDLLSGKYDGAAVTLMLVNHRDTSMGSLLLKYGTFGEVTLRGQQFTAELRGLTQALQQPVGESFSPTCRAELGDTRCKVSMAGREVSGVVQGVSGWQVVLDANRTETDGRYTEGRLTFTSGVLQGQGFRVREQREGRISLLLPWPEPPAVGDGYQLQQGCDKRFTTCVARFANAVNFRGEPHLPGLDRILETPTTRSRL